MARSDESNPLRTGIFGIALVACLVLVSFGYTQLPFWPQGKPYQADFTDTFKDDPTGAKLSQFRIGLGIGF